MKLDIGISTRDLSEVPGEAKRAEELGFAALWSMEAGNDGFLPLALAAEHTQRINLGPSVAIAFPRSPMAMAYTAWDLAALSKGRFILGLGTQVKGHIERRYGVKWEAPVPKLREYVLALKAIFKCWAEGGTKLAFQGKYYNFSLMTPFFAPRPHNHRIPIFIAGVNEHILRLAGEHCDGLHAHPFTSAKYLREFLIPRVEEGLTKAGRKRQDFTIFTTAFVILGRNPEEIEKAKAGVRQQISFYASTRTYKVVLDTHGWGDRAYQLNELAAKGDWASMPKLITDEMLDVYAVTGTYDDIAEKMQERFDGLLDRVAFYVPYKAAFDDRSWAKLCQQFNG
jgi:probable F420-dependent oxidoreductase